MTRKNKGRGGGFVVHISQGRKKFRLFLPSSFLANGRYCHEERCLHLIRDALNASYPSESFSILSYWPVYLSLHWNAWRYVIASRKMISSGVFRYRHPGN